jgi:hypothetical protein
MRSRVFDGWTLSYAKDSCPLNHAPATEANRRTPLDVLNAAQRQADWAAAAALRDALIRLMCAHILDGDAQSEGSVRWAIAAWVLAGGDRITSVLQQAERALNATAAHGLIEATTASRPEVLPDVAAGVWRHIDDADLDRVLSLLDPGDPSTPARPETRQVWANLLWRDPTAWYRRWLKLDSS